MFCDSSVAGIHVTLIECWLCQPYIHDDKYAEAKTFLEQNMWYIIKDAVS